MKLLHAAPYEMFGRKRDGAVHVIRENETTRCGNDLKYMGGYIDDGDQAEITCKGCIRSLDSQERHEQQQAEWQERSAELAAERERENQDWWERYSAYLTSPAWRQRRQLVLVRDGGQCQGCLSALAVHVHHLTYKHVTDELLFELVALCEECHQKVHPDKEIGQF